MLSLRLRLRPIPPRHRRARIYRAVDSAATRNDRVERVMGIEPTSKAWEAFILPLNYTRSRTRF